MSARMTMKTYDLNSLDTEAYVQVILFGLFAVGLVIMGTVAIYLYGVGTLLLSLIIMYVAIPFVVHFSTWLQRHIIFMHRFCWRWGGSDYFNPTRHGIKGGRNLYLDDSDGVRLGLWHILPDALFSEYEHRPHQEWDRSFATPDHPIVIYFHGNMGSRATGHRKELYTILQGLGCHIIAFDYAGFADCRQILPSKASTLADGLLVYDWVSRLAQGQAPIFFWGHSLGSGVASLTLSTLSGKASSAVAGLILEAPFTSLKDVILSHPFVRLYLFWPKFEWLFTATLTDNNFDYQSDLCLQQVKVPIQILHSTNDPVIPYHICKKLVRILKKSCENQGLDPELRVRLLKFDEFSTSFAHAFICRSGKLHGIVEAFIESSTRARK